MGAVPRRSPAIAYSGEPGDHATFIVRSAAPPIFLQVVLKAVFGLDEGHSQGFGTTPSDH
ncbi:hypothetical protein H6F76_13770 [Leptolyngbya sp. FACHB-321]|uniref:hypothetical protein n=1 Tax=Leptolyngbya sp. FACHB-321 TaxID=2692807 RepID=UPI001682E3A4|nr:hypothetical protein [Leptolyngbya sp. FACHB-321]MBD2036087.1 hypothetical protein [Leptolyngbya sp. FACHB-321]